MLLYSLFSCLGRFSGVKAYLICRSTFCSTRYHCYKVNRDTWWGICLISIHEHHSEYLSILPLDHQGSIAPWCNNWDLQHWSWICWDGSGGGGGGGGGVGWGNARGRYLQMLKNDELHLRKWISISRDESTCPVVFSPPPPAPQKKQKTRERGYYPDTLHSSKTCFQFKRSVILIEK